MTDTRFFIWDETTDIQHCFDVKVPHDGFFVFGGAAEEEFYEWLDVIDEFGCGTANIYGNGLRTYELELEEIESALKQFKEWFESKGVECGEMYKLNYSPNDERSRV